MSTKIYKAYKLDKQHNIWEFIRKVKPIAVKNIQERYMILYEGWLEDTKLHENIKKVSGYNKVTLHACALYVSIKYGEQITKFEMSAFDLDVGIRIMELDGNFYLIPYAGSGLFMGVLNFMVDMDELDEYYYFNNADQPEDISDEEWDERGLVWDKLCDVGEWDNYLYLDICNCTGFYRINYPMNLEQLRECVKEEKYD